MELADLHIHSNFSDGSDSIHDLVKKIKDSKIKLFSLTDHDSIEGIEEIEKLIPQNITFIRGVELTCESKINKCHLLGYNFDPQNSKLLEQITKSKYLRQIKLETRIKYLKEVWNIKLTAEELNFLNTRKSIVKTHFANIIVNRKLANDNVSAMKKYLDDCKTPNTKLNAIEAINAIHSAGGTCIWAHPLGGEGEIHLQKDNFLTQLKYMKSIGIDGYECYYSRYNESEISFLIDCANRADLLISGGSDYHGTNKQNISLAQLNTSNKNIDLKNLTLLNKF